MGKGNGKHHTPTIEEREAAFLRGDAVTTFMKEIWAAAEKSKLEEEKADQNAKQHPSEKNQLAADNAKKIATDWNNYAGRLELRIKNQMKGDKQCKLHWNWIEEELNDPFPLSQEVAFDVLALRQNAFNQQEAANQKPNPSAILGYAYHVKPRGPSKRHFH